MSEGKTDEKIREAKQAAQNRRVNAKLHSDTIKEKKPLPKNKDSN